MNFNYPDWDTIRRLTQPFWKFYEQLIGPTPFTQNLTTLELSQEDTESEIETSYDSESQEFHKDNGDTGNDLNNVDLSTPNPEYLEFIRVTREHQAERDRLKKLQMIQKPELNIEEYYKDISEVNTLMEDNLVEVPLKNGDNLTGPSKRENIMIEKYGGIENYNRIRSLEMQLDEHFTKKYQEMGPQFWPVMPLNPRPYLNKNTDT